LGESQVRKKARQGTRKKGTGNRRGQLHAGKEAKKKQAPSKKKRKAASRSREETVAGPPDWVGRGVKALETLPELTTEQEAGGGKALKDPGSRENTT